MSLLALVDGAADLAYLEPTDRALHREVPRLVFEVDDALPTHADVVVGGCPKEAAPTGSPETVLSKATFAIFASVVVLYVTCTASSGEASSGPTPVRRKKPRLRKTRTRLPIRSPRRPSCKKAPARSHLATGCGRTA